MKLAIVGSRNWPTDFLIDVLVSHLPKDTLIVSGCIEDGKPGGVDTWAKQAAARYGLAYKGFPADWDKYRPKDPTKKNPAGMIRNAELVAFADEVVAFHYGDSPGTKNTIDRTRQANKPLTVFWKSPDDDGLGLGIWLSGPPSRIEVVDGH